MRSSRRHRHRPTVLTLRVPAWREGERLDAMLVSWLPSALGRDLGKPLVRRLVMAGAIALDGRPVRRPALTVRRGQTISAQVDVGRLPGARRSQAWRIGVRDVLYRDQWLLAVNKPAGLPTVPSADPAQPSVVDALRVFLNGDDESPRAPRPQPGTHLGEPTAGNAATAETVRAHPYIAVHQRLDRDTTGVVLVVTDPTANRSIARQFEHRQVTKTYRALTSPGASSMPRTWQSSQPLTVPRGRGGHRPENDSLGGRAPQEASTACAIVEAWPSGWLVEARPQTGRKHQVRAHLAASGVPVLGDRRYGGVLRVGDREVPRTMLHAASLSLVHPITGEPLHITAPEPADFAEWLTLLQERPGQRPSRGARHGKGDGKRHSP